MIKKIMLEKIKLKKGPAATVKKRAHKGAPCIEERFKITESADELVSNSGAPAELLSPKNFTKPPNGKAAICQSSTFFI